MFIAIPSRQKPPLRWATPLLFAALWLCFTWGTLLPASEQQSLLLEWGALSGGLTTPLAWRESIADGNLVRLVSAL
ncbi:MAG: rhomboid family intramembrane serine protease, partial [Lysobacter sp.]